MLKAIKYLLSPKVVPSPTEPLSILPAGELALKKAIAVADASEYLEMMVSLGIPSDIAERVVRLDINDTQGAEVALMSCYGRLQYLQAAGLFAAAGVQRQIGFKSSPPIDMTSLSVLGAMVMKPLLSEQQVLETVAYFRTCPVYNGHVPEASADRVGRYLGKGAEEYPFGSYSTGDVAAAPHLIESVLSPEILSLAEAHLGCAPTLVALQAWWNFSEHRDNGVRDVTGSTTSYAPQNYHRDLNDFRMFWIYMYLTDVDEHCGPHQVLALSGDFAEIQRRGESLQDFDPQGLFYQYGYQIPYQTMGEIFGDTEQTFVGKAGSTFLSNGFNFHRIHYPLKKPRLMFAARFSVHPSRHDRNKLVDGIISGESVAGRLKQSSLLRYVTRQIIDWS